MLRLSVRRSPPQYTIWRLPQLVRTFTMTSQQQREPTIDKISDLKTEEAKWVEFKKIEARRRLE